MFLKKIYLIIITLNLIKVYKNIDILIAKFFAKIYAKYK